jgi:hypothetical protein
VAGTRFVDRLPSFPAKIHPSPITPDPLSTP